MKYTGERYQPEIVGKSQAEHYHRYMAVSQFAKSRRVLDIASGEGYGAFLLSMHAEEVVGVDVSREAVEQARSKYNSDRLSFEVGSISSIPMSDSYFDVIVSFETLEHVDGHEQVLSELVRVLKQDGVLIISTPDKRVYSDEVSRQNHYHVKELYYPEFRRLLSTYFKHVEYYGQRFTVGSVIVPFHEAGAAGDRSDQLTLFSGLYDSWHARESGYSYIIAIASNAELKPMTGSIYDYREQMSAMAAGHVASSMKYRVGSMLLSPLYWVRSRINRRRRRNEKQS